MALGGLTTPPFLQAQSWMHNNIFYVNLNATWGGTALFTTYNDMSCVPPSTT